VKQLSENIRILRKANGIPQEELAQKLNVSRQVVSKWETDKSDPPIDTLISLADIYGISLDKLVRGAITLTNEMYGLTEIIKQGDKSMKKEADNVNIRPMVSIDEDSDKGFFPRISPDKVNAYDKFKKAYNLDIESDQFGDADKRVKAMHLYLEALDEGITDAAVNMLRVLTKIHFNLKVEEAEAKLPFNDRINYFIEILEEADNQEGRYYHALLLIYGLIHTEDTENDDMDNGIRMMYGLANAGNEYAMHYVEYIEEEQKE
jgi:transcriptional regulator with XRE-family HTH domain